VLRPGGIARPLHEEGLPALQEVVDVRVERAERVAEAREVELLAPLLSTSQRTRWPMRRSANCVSLKLASIQISVTERTAIRLCPIWTLLPGLTLRPVTLRAAVHRQKPTQSQF
jgi:hypothetical protein